MELIKLLSVNEIVAQIISFLVLVFILRVFAWKRILSLLDQRKEKIASEFQQLENAKLEIENIKASYEEKIGAIEESARLKIQEAVDESRHVAQEIKEKAQADAKVIMEKAHDNIKIGLSQAKEELKEKIVELTINAAEHILKEKLTPEKDKKLILGFLEELDKAK
jgi:F-type H+-transporting ATPase subunit b